MPAAQPGSPVAANWTQVECMVLATAAGGFAPISSRSSGGRPCPARTAGAAGAPALKSPGQRRALAWSTAAAMASLSGGTGVPVTRTVGVPLTPEAAARAVTYGGQSR